MYTIGSFLHEEELAGMTLKAGGSNTGAEISILSITRIATTGFLRGIFC